MRPPLLEMILSQLSYAIIGISSIYTAWLFHTSSSKGLLKRLIIQLFFIIGYSALLVGSWWLLWDLGIINDQQPILVRLLAQIPLCVVIFRFVVYIRKNK